MKSDKIGEISISTVGQKMKIIEYYNSSNITVEFEDGTIIKNKQYSNFKSGNIKNPNYYKDYSNMRFGDLTTIELSRKEKKKGYGYNYFYKCKCDCGNIVEVNLKNLKSGNTKGCGCKRLEKCSLALKSKVKPNNYIFEKEYVIGIAKNTKNKFIVDYDIYEKIKNMAWYENNNGYIINRTDGIRTFLHRFVLDVKDSEITVDHINRNRTDCRKSNLRIVTKKNNAINHSLMSNNKSGYSGVVWHKRDKVWQSNLRTDGKLIHLGCFINKEDAIKARLEAELKYFGEEFAPQRHLFEEYGVKVGE